MTDRRRRIRVASALALVLGLLVVTAACTPRPGTTPVGRSSPAASSTASGELLLGVTHLDPSPNAPVSADGPPRPAHLTVQVRSARSGRILRSETVKGDQVTSGGAGSLVSATAGQGCSATISQEDPSGRATTLLTANHNVGQMALSPDGLKLAYASLQSCSPCGFFCPAGVFPNIVRIVDLATGAEKDVRAAIGENIFGFSWSPNGKNLVVDTSSEVRVLSVAHPDLESAPQLRAPKGCRYSGPVWTTRGIATTQRCGIDEDVGTSLVLLRWHASRGTTTRLGTWPLPKCSYDVTAVTDFAHDVLTALLEPGGSERGCASTTSTHLVRVQGSRLQQIADFGPLGVVHPYP